MYEITTRLCGNEWVYCDGDCEHCHSVRNKATNHIEWQTNWISVNDRLPDKDGRYLVAMKSGDRYHISTRRFKRTEPPIWWKGGHTYGYWARHTCGVRYWQPLPEPPKGE